MKQLIQNFKTGELYVDDLDIPAISKGMVLVQNKFSLISAGTEKSTVDVAKASLINKAKKRPDLVKQVIHVLEPVDVIQGRTHRVKRRFLHKVFHNSDDRKRLIIPFKGFAHRVFKSKKLCR